MLPTLIGRCIELSTVAFMHSSEAISGRRSHLRPWISSKTLSGIVGVKPTSDEEHLRLLLDRLHTVNQVLT